jgi:predicted nucleic acid-binding protein
MESLVKPLRQADVQLAQDFTSQISERVAFTEAVFRKAAEIRAQQNFRTPDALHLAAALEGHCDCFLTGDAKLANFTGLRVELVN